MMPPYLSAYEVATVPPADAERARALICGVSDAMRSMAIDGHFEAFGFLRHWLTTVATA